jgi:hypothetical protein
MRVAQHEIKILSTISQHRYELYADDIDTVGRRESSLEEAFLALSAAAKTTGLKVKKRRRSLCK